MKDEKSDKRSGTELGSNDTSGEERIQGLGDGVSAFELILQQYDPSSQCEVEIGESSGAGQCAGAHVPRLEQVRM